MPRLIRVYITQVLIGFTLAACLVAALLWFNVANLWHLVSHSDVGVLAVFLLWLFNGIVFAGVQFGIYIMRLAGDETPRGGRRAPIVIGDLQPIPARAARPDAKQRAKLLK